MATTFESNRSGCLTVDHDPQVARFRLRRGDRARWCSDQRSTPLLFESTETRASKKVAPGPTSAQGYAQDRHMPFREASLRTNGVTGRRSPHCVTLKG